MTFGRSPAMRWGRRRTTRAEGCAQEGGGSAGPDWVGRGRRRAPLTVRHATLRGWWGNPCGFKSRLRHHVAKQHPMGRTLCAFGLNLNKVANVGRLRVPRPVPGCRLQGVPPEPIVLTVTHAPTGCAQMKEGRHPEMAPLRSFHTCYRAGYRVNSVSVVSGLSRPPC